MPSQKILICIAHALIHSFNMHVQLDSETRGLSFYLSLHLLPGFVHIDSKGSCKTVHMHRLVLTFSARIFDMYQNLMYWLICFLVNKYIIIDSITEMSNSRY